MQNSNNCIKLGYGKRYRTDSESLFLHSLSRWTSSEISVTLSGYFSKNILKYLGWFNEETWSILRPNYKNANWRKKLSKNIIHVGLFEKPIKIKFNSNSRFFSPKM